jgi:hypothetical protein
MQDTHITDVYAFSHKVEVNLDMFGALVLNEVSGEVDDANVIVVDECALCQRCIELLK